VGEEGGAKEVGGGLLEVRDGLYGVGGRSRGYDGAFIRGKTDACIRGSRAHTQGFGCVC
jgi:hypothetical protein